MTTSADDEGVQRRSASAYPDLAPVCAAVAGVAARVADKELDAPTPCPDYTVGVLLGHLTGLALAFRDAASKRPGPTTDTAPGAQLPQLPDDWREVLPRRLEDLARAWRAPEAWQGSTRVGGVDLPGEVAGRVALVEVLVHGWDLAHSTGLPYAPDEAAVRAAHGMLEASSTLPRSPYGPPVPLPADAPLLDRVIGLSGREPHRRPGA